MVVEKSLKQNTSFEKFHVIFIYKFYLDTETYANFLETLKLIKEESIITKEESNNFKTKFFN